MTEKKSRKERLEDEEEALRDLANTLPNDKRKLFFKEASKKIKDPDTYAVLNWVFFGGLHHFYMRRWFRGIMSIILFWWGIYLLFTAYFSLGIGLIIILILTEVSELFSSQKIILEHNNKVQRDLYDKLK